MVLSFAIVFIALHHRVCARNGYKKSGGSLTLLNVFHSLSMKWGIVFVPFVATSYGKSYFETKRHGKNEKNNAINPTIVQMEGRLHFLF
jgi:hypothetical protein